MNIPRNRGTRVALLSLEADAEIARSGFACMFSTSNEYETALISERRAQGHYASRYGRPPGPWPMLFVVGIALVAAGIALVWS
jgi:hypothetical protein